MNAIHCLKLLFCMILVAMSMEPAAAYYTPRDGLQMISVYRDSHLHYWKQYKATNGTITRGDLHLAQLKADVVTAWNVWQARSQEYDDASTAYAHAALANDLAQNNLTATTQQRDRNALDLQALEAAREKAKKELDEAEKVLQDAITLFHGIVAAIYKSEMPCNPGTYRKDHSCGSDATFAILREVLGEEPTCSSAGQCTIDVGLKNRWTLQFNITHEQADEQVQTADHPVQTANDTVTSAAATFALADADYKSKSKTVSDETAVINDVLRPEANHTASAEATASTKKVAARTSLGTATGTYLAVKSDFDTFNTSWPSQRTALVQMAQQLRAMIDSIEPAARFIITDTKCNDDPGVCSSQEYAYFAFLCGSGMTTYVCSPASSRCQCPMAKK